MPSHYPYIWEGFFYVKECLFSSFRPAAHKKNRISFNLRQPDKFHHEAEYSDTFNKWCFKPPGRPLKAGTRCDFHACPVRYKAHVAVCPDPVQFVGIESHYMVHAFFFDHACHFKYSLLPCYVINAYIKYVDNRDIIK